MRLEVSVLFVIFLWNRQFKVLKTEKLPRFYPFGEKEGDQSVERNDDGSSGEVPLSIPFPYFDQNHKSLFVSIILLYHVVHKAYVLYSTVITPATDAEHFLEMKLYLNTAGHHQSSLQSVKKKTILHRLSAELDTLNV